MSKSHVRRAYSFEYAYICRNSVPASEVVPFSSFFSQWSASQYNQWSQGMDSSLLMREAVWRSHNLLLAPLKTSSDIRSHTELLETRDSSCHSCLYVSVLFVSVEHPKPKPLTLLLFNCYYSYSGSVGTRDHCKTKLPSEFLFFYAVHRREMEEEKDLICFVHNWGHKFRGRENVTYLII